MNSEVFWDMVKEVGVCTGVTSHLAFSVPRPPVLRVLALALAFLLPSVGKFAQQRLRGGCREDKIMLEGLYPVTPQEDRSPFEQCSTSSLLPSHLCLSLLPPSSPPSYGALRQIPRPTMLAGPPYPGPGWQPMKEHCRVLLK